MGLFSKIGDFLGDALPAVGTIVGTAIGGPAGGAIGGSLGSVGSGLLGDSDTALKGLNSAAGQSQGLAQLQMEQEFNAAEAQKNRDFQLEMWNKNNEYNSPAAQLERLKQAGINPNAMFGSSGYSPVASSVPSGATGAGSPSIANSLLLQDAQLANLMAQVRKTNSETDLNEQTYGWNQMTEKQRYDSLVNSNEESKKRIDKLISDKDIQEKAFAWAAKLNEEDLKIKFEQANVLRTQWMSNLKSIEKTDQDITESQARVDLIREQAEGQDIQNQIATIEKDFATAMGLPLNTPLEQSLFGLWKKGELEDFYTYIVTSHSNGEYINFRSQVELRNVMNKYNEHYSPVYGKRNVGGHSVYYPADVELLSNGMTKREYQFEFFNKYRQANTKSAKARIRKRFNQIFGPDYWPESLK